MDWSSIYGKDRKPSIHEINELMDCDLWSKFSNTLATQFHPTINVEYSVCSRKRGWNIKFKKYSKNICIVYPGNKCFDVMVTVSSQHILELNKLLNHCSEEVKTVYKDTEFFNGSKWLMIEISTQQVLEDVIKLIQIKTK